MSSPRFLLHLVLALSLTLIAALPLQQKQNTTTTLCTLTPFAFTISNFLTFIPISTNPHPATVSFFLDHDGSNNVVWCSASKPLSAAGVADGNFAGSCSSGVGTTITFTYTAKGDLITVGEEFFDCGSNQKSSISGHAAIAKYCYPTVSQMPQGEGQQCQAPGSGSGGRFDSNSIVAFE